MIDLIKSQWIGIVAIVFVAFGLVSGTGTVESVLGSNELTTLSNPHLFSNSVTMSGSNTFSGATTISGAATLSSTLAVTGATTLSSTLAYLEKNQSLTGSTTLTNALSGSTIFWNTSGGTTTLPAASTATGTVYRFVVASALTATYNAQISSAEGDNIEGSMIVAGAVVDCDASDRIYVLTDGENLGDFVELRSDGQKWFVTQSNALTSGKLLCDG